jgi:osmoprotectant transport system permease protein
MTLAVDKRALLDWAWVMDHLEEVRAATFEHLRLTLIAVVVGFLIASALSLLAIRWRWTFGPITWATGVLYTIPSLALFVMLVPITGLGTTLTAEIALVGYTLLILVRNIVAGIDGVPAPARDAADGMGLTRSQRLWRVEVPLALPAIIAGLRIATVTTVGLVTVTALVGLGGYGDFINEGLDRQFVTEVTLGGALSVVMAVAFDVVLVVLGRLLAPWERRSRRRRRELVIEGNAGLRPGLGVPVRPEPTV